MISSNLYIIFNTRNIGSEGSLQYGVPQGPILNYICGAWVGERCILSSVVSDKYRSLFGVEMTNTEGLHGPFNSEEELKKFGYLMAEDLEVESVKFLDLQTFSGFVASSETKDELHQKLMQQGDTIVNIEKEERKENLLSRLLNKNR